MKLKKLAVTICLALLLILVSVIPISAQVVSKPVILPPNQPQYSYFGQDHSYTVNFRGNGEAIVNLRAIISNNSKAPLNEVSLRVPKVDPLDLLVLQVVRQPVCIQYGQQPILYGQPQLNLPEASCVKYQEPNYYDYYSYGSEYRKAEVSYSGDTISISLPSAIKPSSSGSYLLYFRAFGYARKSAYGVFDYSFETLKVNDKIRNLVVGVVTDSDTYLKEASGKTNYRYSDSVSELKSVGTSELGLKSPQIDSFYGQIGQGEITKNSSNLAALESYTVKGSFADSRLKLYSKEMFSIVIGFLILLGIAIFVFRLLTRKVTQTKEVTSSVPLNFIAAISSSFISSVLTVGYTLFVYYLSSNLSRIFSFEYQLAPLLIMFIVVISFVIYSFILLTPAIVIGVKRGWVWGLSTFGLTVFWLVLFFIIYLTVLFLTKSSPNIPQPIPL